MTGEEVGVPSRGVHVSVSAKRPLGCLYFIFVDGQALRAGYENENEAYIDARVIRQALRDREA